MKFEKKIKMPRTRAGFEELLINTFIAGCTHGYAVEHTGNVYEQEHAGALFWIGKISYEECQDIMEKNQTI